MRSYDNEPVSRFNATPGRGYILGQSEPDNLVDCLVLPGYELNGGTMRINDVVWGSCEIGQEPYDDLLMELARTPLFRRLQAIEQLTLGPKHATMPNTAHFSRWQHIWGSVVFARKMLEGRDDVTPREKMVYQLRTLLSDVGHTAFSHLGDWMFQGPEGKEDLHDQELEELLAANGITSILEKSGFSTDETVFPDVEDWVECSSPNLCIDRVDYGAREILRWGVPTIPLHLHLQAFEDPQSLFVINDQNMLVMKSPAAARLFAAGFSLLPTEHWGHPVHRLQLTLLQSAIRSALVGQAELSSEHPRDMLYGIDSDFDPHFSSWDMLFLSDVMRGIARHQRAIFVQARRHDLNDVFVGMEEASWKFPEFPNPLQAMTWRSERYGELYPPNIEIAVTEDEGSPEDIITASEKGLRVYLPPFKPRGIDPLVGTESTSVPFSELEPTYVAYLEGQRRVMASRYAATILMRKDVAERIVAEHNQAGAAWDALLTRPRNSEHVAEFISERVGYAAGNCFDVISEM